jgi:predicted CXXCH cytochrome family protein
MKFLFCQFLNGGLRLIGMILPLAASLCLADSIVDSKHNLSASGPGAVKAAAEPEICIFCHTPHNSTPEAPLWNRNSSGATYQTYKSTTAKALVGQPTGASKLCLSCHDGTIALGMTRSRSAPIAFQGGSANMPSGRSRLGTDLADDHPISFTYDSALASANGQLKNPSTLLGAVRLDQNSQLQCTSCHDPHDNRNGQFLTQANTGSSLCLACHNQNNWIDSIHATSSKTWNGGSPDPWPHTQETTVQNNGCENCHQPHSAGARQRLLNFPLEESNCYSCHNGNVAAKNIQREFNKASVHPILNAPQVHDPTEDPLNATRHVVCVDCHNPHAAKDQAAVAPGASGALAGVKGINASGAPVKPIANEYELCFRCHADSLRKGPARVTRQFVQTNTRLEFSPGSASYHPVMAIGKNSTVPSLIAPWTMSSMMYCTDCHNSDSGTKAGGTGPNGPHGSVNIPLLERRLELVDFQPESPASYALCYKCHSRSAVLSSPQSFRYHSKHVVERQAACTTCHDPHGVVGKTKLVNFNTTYVTPSSGNRLEFIDSGNGHGSCYLTCHGQNHNPKSY